MKNKSILIIGQTASGKTALAHALSDALQEKNISCEIVNLDAFQIYKDVSIGTAKPSLFEQVKYKYHCIDLCAAEESMDANTFAHLAHAACKEISARGHLPICVGGSGLYLRAFLHGLDQFPAHDPAMREKIRDYAKAHGWGKCYEWLLQVDPVRAKQLHPNDHVRIERALEIFEITKMPVSEIQTKKMPLFNQATQFDSFVIHMDIEKDELKKNIGIRTRDLFAKGWLEEITALHQNYGEKIWDFNCMRAIGYKSILTYLYSSEMKMQQGASECRVYKREAHTQATSNDAASSFPMSIDPQMSSRGFDAESIYLTQLMEEISQDTLKYAKRQKTWNKKEKVDFMIDPKNSAELLKLTETVIYFFVQQGKVSISLLPTNETS